MEEKNYKVYKHTFPNGKVYIGITQQELKRRWQNGAGYVKRTYIRKAIDKYGWQNIKSEVLFDGLDERDACQKERELIKKYKSNDKNFGYNVANGGNVAGKHSAETIQKIRESKIGAKNPMYGKKSNEKQLAALQKGRMHNKGKPLSEETKQKLSIALKGRKLSEETKRKIALAHTGMKLSEEARANLSKARKGIKFSDEHLANLRKHIMKKAQPVYCVETDTVYDSIRDCARKLGIKSKSQVSRVLGTNKTAHGYHFVAYQRAKELEEYRTALTELFTI